MTTTKTTYQGTVTVSEKDLGTAEPGTYAGGIKVAAADLLVGSGDTVMACSNDQALQAG